MRVITLGNHTQGLTKLLADYAPGSYREQKFDNYFGRKIAIDASMHIYQALVCLHHLSNSNYTSAAFMMWLHGMYRLLLDVQATRC